MATSTNFMPIFNAVQRRNLAEIAIDQSLPEEYYIGLHDFNRVENDLIAAPDVDVPVELFDFQNTSVENVNISLVIDQDDNDKREALEALDNVFAIIQSKIVNGDRSLHLGVKKFNGRVCKMNNSQLTTSLNTFGVQQFKRKNYITSSSSLVKRSQKFKIGVQPEAVKRRKMKNGSKRALPKGKCSNVLPIKQPALKRKHLFSVNVYRTMYLLQRKLEEI